MRNFHIIRFCSRFMLTTNSKGTVWFWKTKIRIFLTLNRKLTNVKLGKYDTGVSQDKNDK